MKSSSPQLALHILLNDQSTFDNFYADEDSVNCQIREATRSLVEGSGDPFIYLWGAEGSGSSHLLQAACLHSEQFNLRAQYLPLSELAGYSAEHLLEGMEHMDLVCLDDLHTVMGQHGWDEAMFHLYNRMLQSECRMLVSSNSPPAQLASNLPDLSSRMGWGVVYRLEELNDDGKLRAIQYRASVKGLELPENVAQFIINRAERNMEVLLDYLDRLDRVSLAEQRNNLTIPFVKQVMGW